MTLCIRTTIKKTIITTGTISLSFLVIGLYSSVYAAVAAINGQCGTLHATTISNYPIGSAYTTSLCTNGEANNISNIGNALGRTLAWNCEGLYGGLDTTCNASGDTAFHNNMIANGTGCGTANNQSFVSNAPDLVSIGYSNNNNAFMGNLCQDDTFPISFTKTSLGWDWECPGDWNGSTFTNRASCHADFYFDSQCGNAANTGHATQPSNNLCAPGFVATLVRYNTTTNLREWECEGGGGGAVSSCTAWATDTSTISPMCNPFAISNNNVNSFPGTNLCAIGNLSEWNVNILDNTARWKCSFGNQTTPTCGGVGVNGYPAQAGNQCNGIVNGQTYENLSEITNLGLCTNNGIPKTFKDHANKRERSCGNQNCEAFKNTSTTMCGFATNVPSLLEPTQGLCQQGQVVTQIMKYANTWQWVCSDIQNGGFCDNNGCQLNFPNQAAICEAPRIVQGVCEWQTLIDPDGFHRPNEIIQSGLCRDGYPDPLVPKQNLTAKKWEWTCRGTPIIGSDSQPCQAKVGLPDLDVEYSIPRPIAFPQQLSESQLVHSHVTAHIIGFDPLYLNFTTPYNQDHRLFTQNGYFEFSYEDWAGNQGKFMTFVDWIKDAGPNAFAVYSTTAPTSGHVDVTLSGYNSAQNPTTFSGPCITSGDCSILVGAHPYDLTIRFTDNGEGTFTVTDAQGNTQTIQINVDNIDAVPPTATLQYSHLTPTSENVIVSVISPSEAITMTNNDGFLEYTFTKNGTFTFRFVDAAGNPNSLTATVNWIDKDAPSASVVYSTTNTTDQDVIATLTNFNETGIIVTNNNGSDTYKFDRNGQFVFELKDSTGNKGSVLARVNRINKPILSDLINEYKENICHKVAGQRMPIDIRNDEYTFEMVTVIRNCLMRGFKGGDNHIRFKGNEDMSRQEFLRTAGRFIKLTTDYENNLLERVSDEFINVMATTDFADDISEADARGLVLYTPLMQAGINKTAYFSKPITQREAKYILEKMLDIVGMDTKMARHLVNEAGNVTRKEGAYFFAQLLMNKQGVAMGNNLELLKVLEYRLLSIPTRQKQREFMTKLLVKIIRVPDPILKKVGLHPTRLKEDIKAIIQSHYPERKPHQIIKIKTIVDDYLTEFPDPHNNKIFNNGYNYKMFSDT